MSEATAVVDDLDDDVSPAPASTQGVSADVPDWSRERKGFFEWDPPKSLLASLRAYQRNASRRSLWSAMVRKMCVLRHRFWLAVTGADVQLTAQIEGGLAMPHPTGVVVNDKAKIGPNCLILQCVTIGGVEASEGMPILEGHVDVGAGAKILGPVRIGRHAKIGANAVVLCDVPPYATAVGVPARILQSKESCRRAESAPRPQRGLA